MIADFHNDYLTSSREKKAFLKYSNSKNVVVSAVFGKGRQLEEVEYIAERFQKQKTQNLHLAFEDIGFINSLNFDKFSKLLSFNPIYVTLTWNGENTLGHGINSIGGLKPLGIKAIDLLNKSGVSVDTAHINRAGFNQIIERAETVVNSHTCFSGVFGHPRSINDEQIKLLLQKKGLIGLVLYSPFLTDKKPCTAMEVFRQIDYFVQKFDLKSLAIGTDFYGADDFPIEIKDYKDFSSLYEIMLNHGYDKSSIEDIFYNNLMNFIKKRTLN